MVALSCESISELYMLFRGNERALLTSALAVRSLLRDGHHGRNFS